MLQIDVDGNITIDERKSMGQEVGDFIYHLQTKGLLAIEEIEKRLESLRELEKEMDNENNSKK